MAIFGIFGVGFWVKMVQMPKPFIVMTILTLSVVGAFSVRSNVFDIYLALGLGLFGYLLRRAGISVVPVVLAIVLGGLIEENLRRALIASNDGIALFLDRPIALGVLLFAALTFVLPFIQNIWVMGRNRAGAKSGEQD